MEEYKISFFNSLRWKITTGFLGVLVLLSAVYLYISVFTAEMYFQETSQKLNSAIAQHLSDDTEFYNNGKINEVELKKVFHNAMIINPSIEIYLLDAKGEIMTYAAPEKKIKLRTIPLKPIETFLEENGANFILGPDPRHPGFEKAFSAAKVYEKNEFAGYVYVILGGEEYANATQLVFGSFILRLSLRSMIITLIASIIIGLFVLHIIMKNVNTLAKVTQEFKNGNLEARLKINNKDELGLFAESFNSMADTIVTNIEEMKTMDNLRRDLVANVSHDLRTPLASIQGYVETLMMKSKTLSVSENEKFMTIIFNSTESLKKLIDELFELSKLEAKETTPVYESFSIAELAQDIQQKNMVLAQNKNIKLEIMFDENLPLVFADIRMMERVIQNLLDNAIKFTSNGGTILVILKHIEDYIDVKIKDNGRGISSEDLPNIFERYQKGQRVENRKSKGLGLGLAIVKKILEVHNLPITVKSDYGEGTTFLFKIPIFSQKEVVNSLT